MAQLKAAAGNQAAIKSSPGITNFLKTAAGDVGNGVSGFLGALGNAITQGSVGASLGGVNQNPVSAPAPDPKSAAPATKLGTQALGQGYNTVNGTGPGDAAVKASASKTAAPASTSSSSSAGASGSAASPGYSATDIINYLNNYGNSLGQAAAQYTQNQYANAEQNLANQYALNTELGTNAYKGLANSTAAAGQQMAGDWNAATKADAANATGNQQLLTNSANSMTAEEGNIAKALGLGTSLGQPISNLNQVTQNAVQNLAGQAQTAEQGTNSNAAAAQQLETNMGQNFNNASALANIQGNEAENTALGQMAQQATQAVTNARYQFMPSASDLGNYLMTDPLNQALESKYGSQSDLYEAEGQKNLANANVLSETNPILSSVVAALPGLLGNATTAGTAAGTLTGQQTQAASVNASQQAAMLQALASIMGSANNGSSDLADAELLGQ